MTDTPTLVAILTKQAVNCGDHGQDISTAVAITPGETVVDFARRVLTRADWPMKDRRAEPEWYVTLRLAEPAPEPATPPFPTTESRTA